MLGREDCLAVVRWAEIWLIRAVGVPVAPGSVDEDAEGEDSVGRPDTGSGVGRECDEAGSCCEKLEGAKSMRRGIVGSEQRLQSRIDEIYTRYSQTDAKRQGPEVRTEV